MRLSALKAMRYAGQNLDVGEGFDAKDRDARVLIAVGKAEIAAEQESESPEPARDPLDHNGDGRKGGSRKGQTYKRRDMRAPD